MNNLSVTQKKERYTDQGDGEVIILLYGLFGSVKIFDTLTQHLRQTHRVIVPVFPFFEMGMGVNIFSLLEFVHELADELRLEKFHLLGNSMGGHIALLYTLKYPEKVKSLILSGSSGLFENGMGDSYPKRRDYSYIKAKTELTFYDPGSASKELVDEIYATVNSRRAIQIVSLAKSTIRNNMEKDLCRIHVPCCLIWGCNDSITPPQIAKDFQRLIAHAELHWINECGHVPMLEKPEIFNAILDKFLQLQCNKPG